MTQSMASAVDVRPPRVTLTNLATGVTLEALYNPEELTEKVGASYSKQNVPGLSHQVKQFDHTNDLAYSFSLYFSSTAGTGVHGRNLAARQFLHSLVYPLADRGSIAQAGAPRVLFVWPGLVSLECVILDLSFSYKMFNLNGVPCQWSVAVTLEEIRDDFIDSEEVFVNGTIRGGAPK